MGEDTNLIVIKEIHLQGPSNPHPPNAMLSPGQSAYPVKHSADWIWFWKRRCPFDPRFDPIKIDRVRQLLDDQAFLDIIECRRTGGGYQKGTFTAHRLFKDPDVVKGVGHEPELGPKSVE